MGRRKSADGHGLQNRFVWARAVGGLVLTALFSIPLDASAQPSDGPEDATPLMMAVIDKLQGGRLDNLNFVRGVVREVMHQVLVYDPADSELELGKAIYSTQKEFDINHPINDKSQINYLNISNNDKNREVNGPYYLAAELEITRRDEHEPFERPNEFTAPNYKYKKIDDFPQPSCIDPLARKLEFYDVSSTKDRQIIAFIDPTFIMKTDLKSPPLYIDFIPTHEIWSFGLRLYLIDKSPDTATIRASIVPRPPEDITPEVISLIEKMKTGPLDDPKFVEKAAYEVLSQKFPITQTKYRNDPIGYSGYSDGPYSLLYGTYTIRNTDRAFFGNYHPIADLHFSPFNTKGMTSQILRGELLSYIDKKYPKLVDLRSCVFSTCYEISKYRNRLLVLSVPSGFVLGPQPTLMDQRIVGSIDLDLFVNDDASSGEK